MSEPAHHERESVGRVPSSPRFFTLIKRSFGLTALALILMALFVSAPLQGPADPGRVPNPVKSAWFLLWTQELVSYSKELVYLLVLLLVGFLLLPWWPKTQPSQRARWFPREQWLTNLLTLAAFLGIVGLSIVAAFFRGTNWTFGSP